MFFFRTPKKEKRLLRHEDAKPKSYAWHAHNFNEVLNTMGTGGNGLDREEVRARQRKFGLNEFTKKPQFGLLLQIWSQFINPLSLILVVAFLLTLTLHTYVDSLVIAAALLIAIILGVIQEGRAKKTFLALIKSNVHLANVIRAGKKHEVEAKELVPGDIVEVHGGMQVPADIRLIEAKKLSVNESSLTGEWESEYKHADSLPVGTIFSDRTNMLYQGTFAQEGYGLGVVVETGDRTFMGETAIALNTIEESDTPLQKEMRKVSLIMFGVVVLIVAFIFAYGFFFSDYSLREMTLLSIAIAVASVPEGLPAAVTIILAVGMEALLRRGGLVRNLLAAETLGSTTYVLTDKTGTLTEAKMNLGGIVLNGLINQEPSSWSKNKEALYMLDVSLCATSAFFEEQNGKNIFHGDAVEQAILEATLKHKIAFTNLSLLNNRVDYLAFTSENSFAAGLSPVKGGHRLCINGLPEYILKEADYVHDADGVRKIKDSDREFFLAALSRFTKEGKRLIAVAYKDIERDYLGEEDKALAHLVTKNIFLGLMVIDDPIRKGVKQAISGVKEAGAEVILVTGDNPATALFVAKSVGIALESEGVLTGEDLDGLTDMELFEVMDTVHVFARVKPAQKMRLSEVLMSQGEVVAMTGDGVNDAPALKRASIGVAIGSGTEVAKEASDLVLMNDSFSTIYAAIEEGRRIVSNLRKIVGYLISTSLSEVALVIGALVTGAPLPILPAQILWANIIEEGFMSVAFAFEPGEKDAMKRRPEDIQSAGILGGGMLFFIAFVVTVLAALMLSLYFYLRYLNLSIEEIRSVMFLVISLDSLFMAFAFRSMSVPFWRLPLKSNLFFVFSFFASASALLLAITVPFLREILSYEPLPAIEIFYIFGFCFLNLLAIEVGKYLFFESVGH